MELDVNLYPGEEVVAVLVRRPDDILELRELGMGPARELPLATPALTPASFTIPSLIVVADEHGHDVSVEVRRGEALESLLPVQCVVPLTWPRGVEVAALCYIGPAGSLVLDEPRCFACSGSGKSPISPPGWIGAFGAHCPTCGGSGEYVVKATPTGDDKEVVP